MKATRFSKKETAHPAGITLIELIIAAAILVTALVAVLTLVISNLRAQTVTEQELLAVNLAREGVEVVRQQRDSNWLAGESFDDGLVDSSSPADVDAAVELAVGTGVWAVDFSVDGHGAATRLYRHAAHYDHVSAGGTDSGFQRIVALSAICRDAGLQSAPASTACPANDPKVGIQVLSEVAWAQNGQAKTLTIEDRLYDWRQ